MQVQHYLENWETTVWNIFYAAFYCFRIREIEDQSGINGKPVSPLTTGRYDLLLKLMHDKEVVKKWVEKNVPANEMFLEDMEDGDFIDNEELHAPFPKFYEAFGPVTIP